MQRMLHSPPVLYRVVWKHLVVEAEMGRCAVEMKHFVLQQESEAFNDSDISSQGGPGASSESNSKKKKKNTKIQVAPVW